ncbi:MAG: hypothetical protein QHH07_06580 [Sedimentisphaerales bacterium]|nr:hypothetical protein [Sedimentisphaerales bacterium]
MIGNHGIFTPLVAKDFPGSLTYYSSPERVIVERAMDTQLALTGLDVAL